MVAGKQRLTMGLQETPLPSPTPSKNSSQKGSISRSFGVYFPRSSAQVQPRPPDVTELVRLVEELRERESRLKTEVLELNLLKESAEVVSKLENEIVLKNEELELALKEVEDLRNENEGNVKRVREMEQEIAELMKTTRDENERNENRVREMEKEIAELNKTASSKHGKDEFFSSASLRFQGLMEASVKSNLIKNLKRNNGRCTVAVVKADTSEFKTDEIESDQRPSQSSYCSNSEQLVESTVVKIRSRVPRVPKPPPIPPSSSSSPSTAPVAAVMQVTPPSPPPHPEVKAVAPPPPPPPPKGRRAVAANVRRIPEVVEFYHSIMRRDTKREAVGCTGPEGLPATTNAKDMIGEIENRSAYLIAIKTDVETQGDFIRFLIKEVENVSFTDIIHVVPFVKWLDDELSYLVDERAVLKHFNWPEQKADALREAAFGYCDLKKLESDASSFGDDARQPCSPALKKMQALLEKLEHGLYNLARMRESAMNKYKGLRIPTDWMLETGIVSQIKLASVKLALKYMRRVSAELEAVDSGPEEAELIIQGVRFAFRVHQFAGGFDGETMRAFQELRDKARSCHAQILNQHHKLICRSTPC